MHKRLLLATVALSVLASGCVVVVKDGEVDAEWMSDYEHEAEVRSVANAELSGRVKAGR